MTDGENTINYKYNDKGLRTEKTVNGVTTKYSILNDDITWQKTGENTPIYFIYDSKTNVIGLKYTDGNIYFYVRNTQGDIIKIIDSDGDVVVEYAYDAWGNLMGITGSMAATLGADNPYRYRGYRYDCETGLYYLNQRYYNPQWGRFISPDKTVGETGSLLTHNGYAYCVNNPVMCDDQDGDFFNLIAAAIGAAVGAVANVVANGIGNAIQGKNFFDGWGKAAISGAVGGAVAGLTCGASLVATSAISSAAGSIAEEACSYISGEKKLTGNNIINSLKKVAVDTAFGTAFAYGGNKIASNLVRTYGPIAKTFKVNNFVRSNIGKNAWRVTAQTAISTAISNSSYSTVKSIYSPRFAYSYRSYSYRSYYGSYAY